LIWDIPLQFKHQFGFLSASLATKTRGGKNQNLADRIFRSHSSARRGSRGTPKPSRDSDPNRNWTGARPFSASEDSSEPPPGSHADKGPILSLPAGAVEQQHTEQQQGTEETDAHRLGSKDLAFGDYLLLISINK
jgi:hypothetical protein